MANVKKIQKSVATRIWAWLSRGVNHPMIAAPSEWLVEQLSESLPVGEISDAIWKLARRALTLQFPGLDRPLGSCYYPGVDNMLDVAYHYGAATQRVLRKVASAAAEIVHASDDRWSLNRETGEYARPQFKGAHISECPRLLGQLATAVRSGRAPELVSIIPSFFEEGWDESIAEMRRTDAAVREKFGSYIQLFSELGVESYSFRETIDVECEHGGNLCNHSTSNGNYWMDLGHDGEMETIQEAPHVREHGNQYHIGCYAGSARVRVHGATFLITKRTELWPAGHIPKLSVIVTPEASLDELRERLTDPSGTARPCVTGSRVLLSSLLG